MNLPEWAPSCSGASANSECPSYKKRLVVETQTTTCSYYTSSHTSKVQHTYISSFREPTLLETAGQLLERNIIKHKIVGTIRSWPQPLRLSLETVPGCNDAGAARGWYYVRRTSFTTCLDVLTYIWCKFFPKYLRYLRQEDPTTTKIRKRQNEPRVTCNIVTKPL